MRFSSLVVYCFLYYDAVKKLFPSWEAEKSLLRIIFLFCFVFLWRFLGILFNPALGCMCSFLSEAPAGLEITVFPVHRK